ncbi:34214_t:CDS:1, partial [Gigaspora margarita]
MSLSITNLLQKNNFDVLVLKYRATEYSTVKVTFGKKKEFFRNLIIRHKKISNAKDYENLYNTSETLKKIISDEPKKWLIVSESLMNEDGVDNLKYFSNQSQKFINMAHIYEDNIVDYLKKEYFAESKRITK